jgi:hypothetical protein
LLIQVDCLSMASLGKHMASAPGPWQERTPNLNRLWQEGVKFARYHAAAAGAAAAQAAMMTGLYAYQTFFMHGIDESTKNAAVPRLSNVPLPPELSSDFPTYGKLLRAAGYDTFLLGAWPAFGAAKLNGADDAGDDAARTEPYGFSLLDWLTGSSARRISSRLAACGDRPFCLSVCIPGKIAGAQGSCSDALAALDRELDVIYSAIPATLSGDLITVFTAARGSLPDDGAELEEALHVPLIVHDASERFVAEAGRLRNQLFSSVDLLPLLMSLAHLGNTEWLHESPAWHLLYARRGDLLACMLDADAPGRQQVIYTTEEYTHGPVDGAAANRHVVGAVDGEGSTRLHCCWRPGATELVELAQQWRAHGDNNAGKHSAPPNKVLRRLFDEVIPFELQANMPVALEPTREAARTSLLDYLAQLEMQAVRGGSRTQGDS